MITIATFTSPEEAHLFRMRLGAAGIAAFVQDENFIQTYWLYSNAIGGVRVQINEDDLAAVQEFLASDTGAEITEGEDITCPECGSAFVEQDDSGRRVALAVVSLTAIPLPFSNDKWLCTSCGHHWKLTGTDDEAPENV